MDLDRKLWLRLSPGFVAVASGVFMGLSVAPRGLWLLGWVALAPLWIIVRQHTGKLRGCIGMGLLWGIGYHGTALAWISGWHPLTWLGISWWPSLAIVLSGWLAVSLWGAAIPGFWAGGMAWLDRYWQTLFPTVPLPLWLALLSGTSLWCGLEWLWSRSFLWWTSLSLTQSPANLVVLHLGQLSGPSTVVAALVVINGAIAEILINSQTQKRKRKQMLIALLLVGCCGLSLHLIGWHLYRQPLLPSPATTLKLGIIQGNVPSWIKFSSQGLLRATEGYTQGYIELVNQGVEGVLTPEGAFPIIWTDAHRPPTPNLDQALRDRGIPIWIGSFGRNDTGHLTQSLFTVTHPAEVEGRYNKIKLVPLGEYIPLSEVFGGIISRFSPVKLDMQPGQMGQVLETPLGRAIAGICFDSAFSEIFRTQAAAGGQFILSAANNDSFRSPVMMRQHHAQDVMRAVETDRWAVRATNTGLSGVVDPHGHTQWLSGVNTYEIHAHRIQRRQTQTLYVRWGDWLTPMLLLASAIGWGILLFRWYRKA